ncbi:hypothetical protein HP439_12395 [Sphingobacterium shayense]|uniref:hypothetical protein n=1 Tax=Sphingobacterium shayense TaxID=626343 RepID=UPI0015521C9C|nr:hypothetical protein [Sphingobacterium shayense]NQD71524.1 hypothetical protein [Sphingobacterium shayense]
MWDKVEQWYSVKEAIGISCLIGSQDTVFNLCRVKRDRDGIDILDNKSFSNRDELARYLKEYKHLPVAFQVQGRGILIKSIPRLEEVSKDDIVPVFPNYNEEEYVFSYFAGLQSAWLALARVELVKDLFSFFQQTGIQVVRLFVGPFVVDNVLDQLNGYSGHFSFDGHQISRHVEQKVWESYTYDPALKSRFSVKLQGADIAEQYVMAYAAGFSLLLHHFVQDLHVSYPQADDYFDEHLQKERFKINGMVLLIVFFVLLLVNTVLYTHYQSKYEMIDYQSKEHFSNTSELGKLSESVSRNDSLLVALGWNGGIEKSWLINQLTLSLKETSGMEWQEVEINPVVARRFGGTQGEIDNRFKIVVTGSCQRLNELETWVRTLGQLPWLNQVEISKFVDQKKHGSILKDFVVSMHYSYDF